MSSGSMANRHMSKNEVVLPVPSLMPWRKAKWCLGVNSYVVFRVTSSSSLTSASGMWKVVVK